MKTKIINFLKENPILIILIITVIILGYNMNGLNNSNNIKQKQLTAQDNIITDLVNAPIEISKTDILFEELTTANLTADRIQEDISIYKEQISLAELEFAKYINYRDCIVGQIGRRINGEEIEKEYCIIK